MEADGQLTLLFEYTKFHIGVYITLVGILLAALIKVDQPRLPHSTAICFLIGIVCFLLAGAGGGAIASNIPNYETFWKFSTAKLDTFGHACWSYGAWAHFEHAMFWTGAVAVVAGVAIGFWPLNLGICHSANAFTGW